MSHARSLSPAEDARQTGGYWKGKEPGFTHIFLMGSISAGNARHLQALLAAATKLGAYLQPPAAGDAGQPGGVQQAAAQAMTVNDFLFTAGLDHVNMFSLIR